MHGGMNRRSRGGLSGSKSRSSAPKLQTVPCPSGCRCRYSSSPFSSSSNNSSKRKDNSNSYNSSSNSFKSSHSSSSVMDVHTAVKKEAAAGGSAGMVMSPSLSAPPTKHRWQCHLGHDPPGGLGEEGALRQHVIPLLDSYGDFFLCARTQHRGLCCHPLS
jgi:hypothetical protein